MKVKELMTKNLIYVSPDDTISHAISKMKRHGVHQLLVMGGTKFYGVLETKRIVTKGMEPSATKVAGLATNAPKIDSNMDVQDAVQLLLGTGFKALPVSEGEKIVGIISETDMMRVAKTLVKGLNIKVKEIITPAECVEKGSKIGSVQRIMRDMNVSRVPVLENGRVVGIVATTDLIKLLEGKDRMSARGGLLKEVGAKEKLRIEETPSEAIMRIPTEVSGETSIGEVIDLLKDNGEVIISGGNVGIVTPKDILELFATTPKKQLYVQITGMQNESVEFKVVMDKAVYEFAKKMGKMVNNIEYFFIHVNKIEKGGRVDLYSIRARFKAPFGLFVAHASGWKPLDVIQDVIKKLEREVMKKYGKMEDARRQRRQKIRYV